MKYKHALFLNPYIEKSANSTMLLFPPTGLEYVATSAKGWVEKITLMDLRYEKELARPEALLEFIAQEIDILCVSIGWDRQLDEICRLLNRVPEDIPLIVGGYTATEKVEELFHACPRINIIIRGEGEKTIQDILQGLSYKDILGISFKQGDTVTHNPNRPLLDIKDFPAPDRSLRRHEYVLSVSGIKIPGLTFDTILSARGCPFNCKFCTFSLNPLGQKRNYAERSVDSVIEELKGIKAEIVMFSDDNLMTNPKRLEEICDRILEEKIKKRFLAQVRIDISKHPSLLEKMAKAGFKLFLLGIESPHDWILKQLDKGFTQETIRKAFAVLNQYPIATNGYFIYGNIGESEEEMLYIGQFAKEIGVDLISCNKLRIEKFSPLKDLALRTPGYHITERGELYSDKYSHPALKRIGKKIKFTFYSPDRYLKLIKRIFFQVKFFRARELLTLFFMSPVLIASVLGRELKRGKLKESLTRTFIKNI